MIKLKNILLEIATGDCYEAAGRLFMNDPENFTLVHGMVKGQGPLEGKRFGHAWVEKGDTVYDYSNGKKLEIPKVLYYGIGDIQKQDTKYYDRKTGFEWILKTHHWGPWEMTGDAVDIYEDIPDEEREIGKSKTPLKSSDLQALKTMLQEFDAGDVLLGAPLHPTEIGRWKELGIPYEPNTIDERQLLILLRNWITKEEKNPELGKFLKELLPLKKKFPTILDPIKGRSTYEGKSLYRGTLLPLQDLIYRDSGWKLNNSVDFQRGAIESEIPYTWTAVGEKGFTSWTPSPEVADGFAADYMSKNGMTFGGIIDRLKDGSGMIPVILRIDDTYPTALINPKVMNLIGGLGEYEVLVIGDQIKVKSIIVPNWLIIKDKAEDGLGVDLTQYFKGL